jgi:hypothetical protein
VTFAPDFAEPFLGWRVWLVVEDAGELRLRSVVFSVFWPAGTPIEAECHRRRLHLLTWRREVRHEAPLSSCDCGVYATTLERTAPYLDPRLDGPRVHRVVGRVSLWGKLVECQWGCRASHAYPAEIFVPGTAPRDGLTAEEIAIGLAEYGVPVQIADGVPAERLVGALQAA